MTTKIKFGTKELEKLIGGVTFGKLLQAHRLSDGFSQKDFAKKLKISQSSLCDLEKSRKIPSAGRAYQIAKTLGLSVHLWVEVALQDQLKEQGIKLKVSIA